LGFSKAGFRGFVESLSESAIVCEVLAADQWGYFVTVLYFAFQEGGVVVVVLGFLFLEEAVWEEEKCKSEEVYLLVNIGEGLVG
jgi:hypothetical protein